MNSAILLLVVCSAVVGVMGGPHGPHKGGKFHEMHEKCLADNEIDEEIFRGEMHKEEVTDERVKCVFACMAKNIGIMAEDGTIDKEKVINHIPPHVPEEQREEIKQRNAECAEMTGDNLCETAYLVMKCSGPKRGRGPHGHGPPPPPDA